MARQPKSKGKLEARLTLDDQERLRDAMVNNEVRDFVGADQSEGLFRDTRRFVAEEFGIAVSLDAVSTFWHSVCVPYRTSRLKESAKAAELVTEMLDANHFDEATRGLLSQKVFEISTQPNADPKVLSELIRAIVSAQKLDLDRDKFEALQSRALAADKAQAVAEDSRLSAEEKLEKMREALR